MKRVKRVIGLTAVLALLSVACLFSMVTIYAEESLNPSRIIVSMGDSYSAGEGIIPFYDQCLPLRKKVKSKDWIAHRSKKAWPGYLTLPGVDMMLYHRNENWFFVAATGAETRHFNEHQSISYRRWDGNNLLEGRTLLAPQLDIFDELREKGLQADYVTMTIGGNDADFAGIISTAAMNSVYTNPNALYDKVELVWYKFYSDNGIEEHLRKLYRDVAKQAGDQAEIIVVGYPRLLAGGYRWFFDSNEAQFLNESVSEFNDSIESIVSECATVGLHIHFVSVEGEFMGHGAYADNPYINEVMLPQDEDHTKFTFTSAYSIHPNEEGAWAYARCVQAKIDELEKKKKIQNSTLIAKNSAIEIQNIAPSWNPDEEPENNRFYDDMWTFRLLPDGTAELIEGRVSWDNRYYIHVPAKVESGGKEYKVASIGEGIFSNHDIVYSVSIDEGITTIRSKAFFGAGDASGFENPHLWASIPDSVVYIAEDAFDLSNPDLEIYANPGSYARRFFERHNVTCKDPYK